MSMNASYDVLCIGNAHVDIFLTIPDASPYFHTNEKDCEICIRWDQKILVDASDFLLGGGASNVAVGLSRLGLKTTLVAEIGDDELSRDIITKLALENVDTSAVIQTKNTPSSFSVGLRCADARSLFVSHVHRKHEFVFDGVSAGWVYLGGLGKQWHPAYQKTREFVEKTGTKLAFAPGTNQIEAGREEIEEELKVCDILFLNKQEAIRISNDEFLSSKESSNDKMSQLLSSLKKLGPKIVVITDGEHGSYVIDQDGKIYTKKGSEKKAAEKTGAGDAYASGFLAAFVKVQSLDKAMQWGSINAGSVIERIGAQTGLLRIDQIEQQG